MQLSRKLLLTLLLLVIAVAGCGKYRAVRKPQSAKPAPEAKVQRESLPGVEPGILKGLTFDYQCPTDHWRIDGALIEYGAEPVIHLHGASAAAEVPGDIVVTWVSRKDSVGKIPGHDLRLTYKGITRDLAGWIGDVDGISYKSEIAAAFNDIAFAKAGKKVATYKRYDAGDMLFMKTVDEATKDQKAGSQHPPTDKPKSKK